MTATAKSKKLTKLWTRDASDELAARNGCWFDEGRGQFVVDWLHDYLRLYEGECAGQPFECKDWQYEATMRMFGWVRHDEDRGRDVRRFRKASIWIPKKNKKSPTLAAWCVYTAFGDGEMGQKCFPTAKDGRQIKENVVRHIHEMIRQSDELNSECTINRQTGAVYHERTKSLILPLSSDNVRAQKANEGLNGSIFVDEVHVVDKAHMRRVSRAGISRPEPLQVEVSTSGDDEGSYGKSRFDYAEGVIDGRHEDDQTLAIIYAAPQQLSDAELAEDPEKWGRLANPAWGHTIHRKEFLQDFATSRGSMRDLADFKMYRLNIWQRSSSPWLSMENWAKCADSFYSADDFRGATAYGGLDMSLTRDMTGFTVIVPQIIEGRSGDAEEDFVYYQFNLLWITKTAVDRWGHLVNYEAFAKADHLRIVDAGRIDFSQVQDEAVELCDNFSMASVTYDPVYGSNTAEAIAERCQCEIVEFKQTLMEYAEPTQMYERLVNAHLLKHQNNSCLNWQAGHAEVTRPDRNGNYRVVKPQATDKADSREAHKCIDGVISGIMALREARKFDGGGPSVYETPGMLGL
jgi:phage terminase large subunit-like protein